MGDQVPVTNNNTQSIADYLAQLLKDKKQLAAFPNVFLHMERLLDEGEWRVCHDVVIRDWPQHETKSWDVESDQKWVDLCFHAFQPQQCDLLLLSVNFINSDKEYLVLIIWLCVSPTTMLTEAAEVYPMRAW